MSDESLDPYWQGFYAPQNGLGDEDCPYELGTLEHAKWMEGFREASPEEDE